MCLITFIPERNGTGHITRCLNLLTWIEKEIPGISQKSCFIFEENLHFENLCSEKGIPFISVNSPEEISQNISVESRIIILDKLVNSRTQKLISELSPTSYKILIHDEFSEISEDVDCILCGIPFSLEKSNFSGIRKRGCQYFIVNPQLEKYRNIHRNYMGEGFAFHFGGYDVSGIYNRVIPCLKKYLKNFNEEEFHLFCGADDRQFDLLEKELGYSERVFIYDWIKDPHDIISKCRLLFCSGGNLLYEACYCGYPFCLISHNQRQERLGEWFCEKTGGISLGQGKTFQEELFFQILTDYSQDYNWLNEISRKSRKLISFQGREEIISIISGVLL